VLFALRGLVRSGISLGHVGEAMETSFKAVSHCEFGALRRSAVVGSCLYPAHNPFVQGFVFDHENSVAKFDRPHRTAPLVHFNELVDG
jgi:hypothetical protein